MKYGIVIKQADDGCDYTIGCGLCFEVFEAADDGDAFDKARERLLDDSDPPTPAAEGEAA